MAYTFAGAKQEPSELEAYEVHHWPIVRGYAERAAGVSRIGQSAVAELDGD